MPELSVQERLQPSLLDRLTDDEPGNRREGRDYRGFSLASLRNAVLRDLSWLLNTCHLDDSQKLDDYPQVRSAVVNYGVPSLTGKLDNELTAEVLAARVTECLSFFEPRLLRDSLRVNVVEGSSERGSSVQFIIEADLWAQPVPLRIFMKTELDRELNAVRVVEQQGARR